MSYNNCQIEQYNKIMHEILDLNITCELKENLLKKEIETETTMPDNWKYYRHHYSSVS